MQTIQRLRFLSSLELCLQESLEAFLGSVETSAETNNVIFPQVVAVFTVIHVLEKLLDRKSNVTALKGTQKVSYQCLQTSYPEASSVKPTEKKKGV